MGLQRKELTVDLSMYFSLSYKNSITPKTIEVWKFEFCKKFHDFEKVTALLVGGCIKQFLFWYIISCFLLGSIWLALSSVFFRRLSLHLFLSCIIALSLIEEATCGSCLQSASIAVESSLCSLPILVLCNFISVIFFLILHWQNTDFHTEGEVYFSILRNLCGAG